MSAHSYDNFICIVIISYIMNKDRISQLLRIRFLYMMKRASHEQCNHRQVQI
jgi:hypothetical protein